MVAQIVTIVNQSGKVIKSSKTLISIFAEAKSAYNEKKAELKEQRRQARNKDRGPQQEEDARRQLDSLTLDDEDIRTRRSADGSAIRRKPVPRRQDRPQLDGARHDSFYTIDDSAVRSSGGDAKSEVHRRRRPSRSSDDEPRSTELLRRHTDMERMMYQARPRHAARSASMDDIDMDLAYGELPPPPPMTRSRDTAELREKMTTLQILLNECNCLQHSATTIIERLSKNPDTMAAVALTLAEISNLAAKLAPGALTAMKSSFPAIVALLASPQFAIAAGVGVGITIIAFGSYKIIKKIQARKDERMLLAYGDGDSTLGESVDELRELNRIEHWRRGIANAEAESAGTSVDGELITPMATRTLIEEGRLTEADLKSKASSRRSRTNRSKSEDCKSGRSKARSSGRSSRTKHGKKPSGLRTLFKS